MTDSDNVELKKRARRRLVGAAALALLAAIILPMVMDQEPNAPAQDIQVTIPDREADNTLSRPIAGRAARDPEPQLAPPPEEQPPTAAPPDAPRQDIAANVPSPQRPAPPRTVPSPAPSDTPRVSGVPSAALEAPKPAPVQAARAAAPDSVRAQAILDGKPAAPSAPAAGSGFVVQIGAFGDGEKAAAIAADLKRSGFTAYTEKVGAMTRVRVGPFGGRDDAEKAAQRVRARGMSGSVVSK